MYVPLCWASKEKRLANTNPDHDKINGGGRCFNDPGSGKVWSRFASFEYIYKIESMTRAHFGIDLPEGRGGPSLVYHRKEEMLKAISLEDKSLERARRCKRQFFTNPKGTASRK